MPTPFEISFDGATLRGEAEGFGVPVVLLHAGVADRRMWTEQVRALADEGYHAVSYDRRGFGQTETGDVPFSHVVDLEAVLDRLDIQAAVLVGASKGGALAIDFTFEHPERVIGLVLVGTAVTGASGEESDEDIAAIEDTLEYAMERGNLDLANRIEAHLWLDGPRSPDGRVQGPPRDLFLEMNAIALNHPKLTQEETPESAVDHLGLLTAPVLIVCGALDYPEVLTLSEELADSIESGFPIVIEDTAHLPPLERPDLFNPPLLEFLDAISGRTDVGDEDA